MSAPLLACTVVTVAWKAQMSVLLSDPGSTDKTILQGQILCWDHSCREGLCSQVWGVKEV